MANSNFWMMTYGDELLKALKDLPFGIEKSKYLRAYGRMGDYVKRDEEHILKDVTFGEYYRLIEKKGN